MPFLRLTPTALAAVLLAAHVMRGGHYILAGALAAAPCALILRASWVKRAAEVLLGAGILVWLWTAAALLAVRLQEGRPWLRMTLILAGVAAFNGLALALLQGERMRDWFRVPAGRT